METSIHCGAWLLPWAAPAPRCSGDVVLAQSRGAALPFLLSNGVQEPLHFPSKLLGGGGPRPPVSVTATTDPTARLFLSQHSV